LTSECEAGETDADATDIYLKIFKIFYTIARRSKVKGHENGQRLVFQAFKINFYREEHLQLLLQQVFLKYTKAETDTT